MSTQRYAVGRDGTKRILRDGEVLRDGDSVLVRMLAKDGATRKPLAMMTDAERQTMRDSVKGMPLSQAAALPIYDAVRGSVMSGRPAQEHYALIDGAEPDRTAAQDRADAYRDGYVDRLSTAWRA